MKGKGAYEMSQNQTKKSSHNGSARIYPPDPEVVPRAARRRFSVTEKRRILEEADACTELGQIGALLRREGIYSSYLADWRRERENGQLQGLTGQQRGRPRNEQATEMARLQQENEQLKAQLDQAALIITAQKKLSQALEQTLMRDKELRS
jgi:transposase-like protein